MWWGVTPALDILDECKEQCEGNERSVNVLLVGQYDCRHVLKTIAHKYRHPEDVTVKLYICEPLLENIARELLFITLMLEPSENLGLMEKSRMFMELYGNTLLRPATANYLIKVAQRLLHMVTNFNYAQEILPLVSLDELKYKERDQLETIFKYWASKADEFDILKCWDERVRAALGQRYDMRGGVYDWDYHMRYRPYGADILGAFEYKKFREKGVAFYWEDTDPCVPNRTLASAIFSAGAKLLNYGYLGDISTGPYVTFGFSCEDEDMLKKVNGHFKRSSTEVTERNVLRMMHEVQHHSAFIPSKADTVCTTQYVMADTTPKLKIQRQDSSILTANNIPVGSRFKSVSDTYISIPVDKIEIIFLPTTALRDYPTKEHFENFFDVVTIPQTMVLKHFTPELVKIMKPDCKIIVDTPKYLLGYRKEDLEKFKSDLEELMSNCSCCPLSSYDFKRDEFVRYQVAK